MFESVYRTLLNVESIPSHQECLLLNVWHLNEAGQLCNDIPHNLELPNRIRPSRIFLGFDYIFRA